MRKFIQYFERQQNQLPIKPQSISEKFAKMKAMTMRIHNHFLQRSISQRSTSWSTLHHSILKP